ncbi:T6SS immunity protein Tli4 family protein [Acinetobacter nematophilus]|uniref:T6SS immunity protein Tli4 family protein n=1 Tax=Acinetobacter nematophilus TaxID=2994642 RepID=A0A9X3DUZ1_9GAMM|nr:T6SS immunity protein Tli4 family protein [Acinetobacter nematophilus]MCX5468558.1 T6SS immunity protein Tli4 family protein [Acinetobacter nematophilus]
MNKIYASLLLTACVFSVGCASAKSEIKKTGNNMINLEQTKTYCIGRYVVDIPAEANPLKRYDKYDSFNIKVKENASRQDFEAAIQKVKKEYSEDDWFITDDPQVQKIDGRMIKIFKGKLSDKKILPYDVAGFVWDRNTLFLIEGMHSDTPQLTTESNEAIQNLVKNLHYRPENEIPKEAGQCIYKGFIKDETKQYRYSIQTLAFDFKNHPTVVLRFEAESSDENVSAMIPRIEKKLKEVGQSQRQMDKDNIRKGEKNTAQLNGQEWISIEKMKGKNGLSALWEHTGTAKNNQDPLISFEVDTGYDSPYSKSSSLHQVDALKLYESILKTIAKF